MTIVYSLGGDLCIIVLFQMVTKCCQKNRSWSIVALRDEVMLFGDCGRFSDCTCTIHSRDVPVVSKFADFLELPAKLLSTMLHSMPIKQANGICHFSATRPKSTI